MPFPSPGARALSPDGAWAAPALDQREDAALDLGRGAHPRSQRVKFWTAQTLPLLVV